MNFPGYVAKSSPWMSRYLGWYHMAPVLVAAAGYYLLPHPEAHICKSQSDSDLPDCAQYHNHLAHWREVHWGSGLVWDSLSRWAILTIAVLASPRVLPRRMGHGPSLECLPQWSGHTTHSLSRSGHSLMTHRTVLCHRSGHVVVVSGGRGKGRWQSTHFPLWVEFSVHGKVPKLSFASAYHNSHRWRLCLHTYAKILPCRGQPGQMQHFRKPEPICCHVTLQHCCYWATGNGMKVHSCELCLEHLAPSPLFLRSLPFKLYSTEVWQPADPSVL